MTKPWELIRIIGAMLALVLIGFIVGEAYNARPVASARNNLTIEQAIDILKVCRYSHQWYVDNPWDCTVQRGNREFHVRWVDNYQAIIELLEEIQKEGE